MLSCIIRQNGSSLVELMISITLGFASMTAMSSLVAHGIALNSQLITKSRLNAEVNAVLAVISQDLKRAGYQASTKQLLDDPQHFVNPFEATLDLAEFSKEPNDSCILFAYDRNQNGALDTLKTNENYGYRLRGKAIEMRVDGLGCDKGGWQDLTDPSVIKVNSLLFIQEKVETQKVGQHRISIQLQAELTNNPDISRYTSIDVIIKNYE